MIDVSPRNPTKRSKVSGSQVVLLTVLCAIVLITVSWTITLWTSIDDLPMSQERWIALGLGLVFSLPIGCGVMALMFYSSRSGHDQAATPKFRKDDA